MATHYETGKKGEELARHWLVTNGFRLLHQNWRYSHYEIDLIAQKTEILHFIEVKTRQSLKYGQPETAVSRSKLKNLFEAAAAYQYQFPGAKRIQFDVLAITIPKEGQPEFLYVQDLSP